MGEGSHERHPLKFLKDKPFDEEIGSALMGLRSGEQNPQNRPEVITAFIKESTLTPASICK
jgi:hypothetical protein